MNADEYQIDGNHYKERAVQPWAVMGAVLTYEEFVGYLKGNIIKYSMRDGTKEGANSDDLKCSHYIHKLREVTDKGYL